MRFAAKIILFTTICVSTLSSGECDAKKLAVFNASNPSEAACEDQPVMVSLMSLGINSKCCTNLELLQLKDESGNLVPLQLIDIDGDGDDENLLFLESFKGGESKLLTLGCASEISSVIDSKRTQADLAVKTGGEWKPGKEAGDKSRGDWQYHGGKFENVSALEIPEKHSDHSNYIRYEGVGIESDKVGYRIYLDWRNGFDIFGKTSDAVVLDQVGQDGFESYHHMADWGMDILKVGSSLGMGGYGYWDGSKVVRVSDTDKLNCKIVEDGNLYSAIDIEYKGWKYLGESATDLKARLSMTAGSRVVEVILKPKTDLEGICAGLVKHEGTEFIQGSLDITGEAWTYIATWGKQSLDGKNLGMAILFKRMNYKSLESDDVNHVVVFRSNEPKYHYKFLAAYEGEQNGIETKEDFVEYLEKTADQYTIPLRVNVKTSFAKSRKVIPSTRESALELASLLADTQLELNGTHLAKGGFDQDSRRSARWSYTTGLISQAYDDLYRETGETRFREQAFNVVSSFISESGEIEGYKMESYNIDQINSGKMLLRLFKETGEEKYRKAADVLRNQLRSHPRTSEGGFWHKQRYPYQLWLDGVYMGMPFLAEWEILFNGGEHVDEAVHEFELVRKYCKDSKTGLYYHAWDEKKEQVWANKETGLSDYFWGRGFGWYCMAIVDTLDLLGDDHNYDHEKALLLDILGEVTTALIDFQDPTSGCWYQILDQADRAGNYLESSGSSMFVYMMAKALNQGYLNSPEVRSAALRAYDGMVQEFIEIDANEQARLTQICRVAGLGYGRDGSYKYYMSEPVVKDDPKGLGPFIMASVEVSKLLKSQ